MSDFPCTYETARLSTLVECPPDSNSAAWKVTECNASFPTIQTINYPTANIEQTITIPKAAKRFSIKFRCGGAWRFAFVENETINNYDTVGHGGAYKESGLCLTDDLKIYVFAERGSRDFILRYWT